MKTTKGVTITRDSGEVPDYVRKYVKLDGFVRVMEAPEGLTIKSFEGDWRTPEEYLHVKHLLLRNLRVGMVLVYKLDGERFNVTVLLTEEFQNAAG